LRQHHHEGPDRLLDPKYIEVWGKFTLRAEFQLILSATTERPGREWEEVAKQRLHMHDLYPEKIDNR
jgi:7-cyano-7-deazaguanine reductase